MVGLNLVWVLGGCPLKKDVKGCQRTLKDVKGTLIVKLLWIREDGEDWEGGRRTGVKGRDVVTRGMNIGVFWCGRRDTSRDAE